MNFLDRFYFKYCMGYRADTSIFFDYYTKYLETMFIIMLCLKMDLGGVVAFMYIFMLWFTAPIVHFISWFNECGWLILKIWWKHPSMFINFIKFIFKDR